MKLSYLSYSTVESFLNCKLQLVKNRELRDKLPSATKNSASEKGNLAHACLEIAFKIKSSNYNIKDILLLTSGRKGTGTKLLKGFDEKWIKDKRKLLQTKYKDRNVFYNICEELAFKLAPKFNLNSKFGNTKQALEDVLETLKYSVFHKDRIWFTTKPEEIKYVEYELEAESTFGYPLLMYIDLVLDIKGAPEIYLIDWKSGKKYWDARSVENSLQFDFYAVGFSIDKNIKKPIRCYLDSLNQNKPFYTIKTPEQVRIADSFFSNIWDEILNVDVKKAEPTINEYCSYCLFYNSCEAIKIADSMKIETVSKVKLMNLDQLAEQSLKFSSLKKFYENMYYKYQSAIQDKIKDDNFIGQKYEVSFTEVDNYKISPSSILKHVDFKTALKNNIFEVSVAKTKEFLSDKTLKSVLKQSINKPYKKINITKIKLQSKNKTKKAKK